MSKNELLPILNLIFESYASGLKGDGKTLQAWANQFSEGEPSYGIGFRILQNM